MNQLRDWWNDQRFFPTPISIMFHPSYIIRRKIADAVSTEADQLHGRILDFGCGSKPYKRLFVNSVGYIGIETKISGHDHKRLESDVDVYYDGKRLPFADSTFDNIVAFEVLEHLSSPELIMPELYRVLRSGGRVLITTPFVWPEHEVPYDFVRYSSFGLRNLFERQGFTILKIDKIGNSYEAIFQLLANTIAVRAENLSVAPRFIFRMIFVFPLSLIGILSGKLLPNDPQLYLNNMLVAIKV